MEKRQSCRRGRRRREGFLAMGLSVCLSGCLAVTIVCLELRKNAEMSQVLERISNLELETAQLKKQLLECQNNTRQIMNEWQNGVSEKEDADEYYDDEYDSNYEYNDEEPAEQPTPANRNKTSGAYRHHQQTRHRRAIPHKYNLIIEQNPKVGHYPRKPLEVKARIYVEKDGRESREEQVGPPAEVIRHDGFNPQRGRDRHHYNGHHDRWSYSEHRQQTGSEDVMSRCFCNNPAIHVEQSGGPKDGARMLMGEKVGRWNYTDIIDRAAFEVDHDHITIRSEGIYYVYAQLYYTHTHDKCGFWIARSTGNGQSQSWNVSECTSTAHHNTNDRRDRRNSCYTGRLINLKIGDQLFIKSHTDGANRIRHGSEKSFFGAFKVS